MDRVGCTLMSVHGIGAQGREGFALLLVLLALTLLMAIGAAALAAALGQLRAASAAGQVLKERVEANAATDLAIHASGGAPVSQVGDSATEVARTPYGPSGWQRVLDLRLSSEMHLFLGEATLDGDTPARSGRLVWWLDPATRVAAYRGVVESDSVDIAQGARLTADSILAGRAGIPSCDAFPLLAVAFARQVGPTAPLPGPPEWGSWDGQSDFASVRLGWYGRGALSRLADHRVEAGASLPSVDCTGCWSGLVFSEGSTAITQRGAGVLIVEGDLTLASGASWTGLILVSGNFNAAPNASIQGMMRVGGLASFEPGAIADGSACAALYALLSAPSLIRPIPMPGRSRLAPLSPATG